MSSIAFVLALAAAHPDHAVSWRQWTMDDGLPQSTVTDISQTGDGLLVAGTFGGLVRFDGVVFQVWDGANSPIESIRVTAVAGDEDGSIWFGTQEGQAYHMSAAGSIRALEALDMGVVWDIVLVDGVPHWGAESGLFITDGGRLRPLYDEAPVNRIVDLDDGTLALATGEGVVRFGPDGVTVLAPGVDLWDLVAWRGGFVVSTNDGTDHYRLDGTWIGQLHPGLSNLTVGADDTLWIASVDALSSSADGQVHPLAHPPRSLVTDREGSLWLGLNGGGLMQIHTQPFRMMPGRSLPTPVATSEGWAHAACPDGQGAVFRLEHPDVPLWRGATCPTTLAAVDGSLWVGTGAGELFDVEGGLLAVVPGAVRSIAPSGNWVGTTEGLFRRQADGWRQVLDLPGPVSAIVEHEDSVWVGAGDGAVRWQGEERTDWRSTTGMPSTPVRDIWPRHEGAWIGSYGSGMAFVSDAGVVRLDDGDGLAENVVSRILPDGRGHVWLLGNRGVSRVPFDDLDAFRRGEIPEVRARLYHTGEGSGGNQPAGSLIDHEVWMPVLDGTVQFDLNDIVVNDVVPTVVLRAALDDRPAGTHASDPHALTVDYTLGTLLEPSLARFKYRFDDEPWVDVGSKRQLTWESLPSGPHTLAVVGANEDGVPSAPAQLTFFVPAPWYEQWSMRLALLAAMGALGYFAQRSRTAAAESANRRLQVEATQRRHAERRAQEREAHYRELFEGAGEGLLLCDGAEVVLEANPAARHLLRGSSAGVRAERLFGPPDEDGVSTCTRFDGTTFPATVKRLELAGGTLLLTVTDVTALQASAEAQRLEAIGRLAGGVAHDVNNLLTAMSGAGALLRQQLHELAAPLEAHDLLDDLDRCVDRGGTLTRELMAFGRRQVLCPQVIDAVSSLEQIRPVLERASRDGVDVVVDPGQEPLFVEVDPAQLELAVLNLVLNGVAAHEHDGQVHVLTDADDKWVTIEVRDRGAGIPPEVLPHIYEPFFTTKSSGTGLGLPSVHGFVAQSRGELQLTTEPGSGTSFCIVLPRRQGPRSTPAMTIERPLKAETRRILVCDDDAMVLNALRTMLKGLGFDVVAYQDASDAAEHDPEDVDLLVTDVSMPNLRGPELASRLRVKRPTLPVLYVSGYTQDADLDEAPGDFLPKPFGRRALLDALTRALVAVPEDSAAVDPH